VEDKKEGQTASNSAEMPLNVTSGEVEKGWQGKKDSNLRMLESKSSALTNLATPLHERLVFQQASS
jgi:hypothetical protein